MARQQLHNLCIHSRVPQSGSVQQATWRGGEATPGHCSADEPNSRKSTEQTRVGRGGGRQRRRRRRRKGRAGQRPGSGVLGEGRGGGGVALPAQKASGRVQVASRLLIPVRCVAQLPEVYPFATKRYISVQ